MRDAFPMRGIQGVQNLARVCDGLFQWKRTCELSSLNKLNYQVHGADIVELADVWMVQRRNCTRFALEAFGELGIGNFQGNNAIQSGVTSLVHLAHATRTDQGQDLIRSETRPSTEGHG